MCTGVKIRLAAREDKPELLEFLLDYFIKGEPINKSVGLTANDEVSSALADVVDSCLKHSVSFVARDELSEKIVGSNLVVIIDTVTDIQFPPVQDSALQKWFAFDNLLEENLAYLLPHAFQKLAKIEIVTVHPDYRRLGIALKLTKRSLEAAKQHACDAVFAASTALARKNCTKSWNSIL